MALSRATLIESLRSFAAAIGETPTRTRMNDEGPYSAQPYYRAFGSWNDALRAAGLAPNHENDVPDERLVRELRRLDGELDRVPRFEDVAARGAFSPSTYVRRWGSWPEAKAAAGLREATRTSRRIERETLVTELRRLSIELERTPTQQDMIDHGEYSQRPYYRAFDSWNDAVEAAGLDVTHRNGYAEDELLAELERLADELGHTPTREEMDERGDVSSDAYVRTFGSWTNAWRAAGLDDRAWYPARASEAELLEAIEGMVEALGRVPTRAEMDEQGAYSREPFERAFGTWGAALEAAGYERYHSGDSDGGYVYYGSSWPEQRRAALRRDQYRCQHEGCSLTDADHRRLYENGIEVHHRVKFREFDDHEVANRLENLVTLCRAHHVEWERP
jgi:hypothetical protein